PVAGALLVAPADVDRPGAHPDLAAFKPSPRQLLPFPSIVVASSDDPWIAVEQAHNLASRWGSHFIDVGPQGHLNAASGIGGWIEGQELLNRVLDAAADHRGQPRTAGEARQVLAVEATEAAERHYLG
ncbi:RBBP9/YdeN family alpha/beta hydrolase, partial [Sphingomonas sp.]|uniref:RBBP9/YdeN family alpha/beta hydrolase n=1 Tax=Sphingomonas sp. TaxID=28214 RepID=UPI002C968290